MLSITRQQFRRIPVRNISTHFHNVFADIAEKTDDLVKKTGQVAQDTAQDVTEKSIEHGVKLGLRVGEEVIKQLKQSDTTLWTSGAQLSISFTLGPVSVTLSDFSFKNEQNKPY